SMNDRIRQAVETAEKHADGLVGDAELLQSHYSLLGQDYATGPDRPHRMEEALLTVAAMATTGPGDTYFHARIHAGAHNVRQAVTRAYLRDPLTTDEVDPRLALQAVKQADMLRDLFGPLLFRKVSIDPAWMTRRKGAIKELAQAIDRERRYDDMSMLADALEEA